MGGVYDLWKSIVPMRERFYLQTLFGDREKPLTEEDLTPDDLKSIESTIQEARGNRIRDAQKQLSYSLYLDKKKNEMEAAIPVLENAAKNDPDWVEYQTLSWEKDRDRKRELWDILEDKYYSLVGSEQVFYPMLDKPKEIGSGIKDYVKNYLASSPLKAQEEIARLESDYPSNDVQYEDYLDSQDTGLTTTFLIDDDYVGDTLGKFNYKTDNEGNRVVIDDYDFHNETQEKYIDEYEKMGPLEKLVQVAKRGGVRVVYGQGIKGVAQSIGNAYIGRDGRKVNIKYDPEAMASGGVVIDDNNPAKRRRLI